MALTHRRNPGPARRLALGVLGGALPVSVALSGAFNGCHPSKTQVSYDVQVTMVPRTPASISQLNKALADVMRGAGWKLQSVDVSQGPISTIPHPAYLLTRANLHGAANILPAKSQPAS